MIVSEIGKALLGEAKDLVGQFERSELKKDLAGINKANRMMKKFKRQCKKGKIDEEEKDFLIEMVKASLKENKEE